MFYIIAYIMIRKQLYNNEHPGISIITGIREEQYKIIKNALTKMIEKQKENEKSKEDIPN